MQTKVIQPPLPHRILQLTLTEGEWVGLQCELEAILSEQSRFNPNREYRLLGTLYAELDRAVGSPRLRC